MKRTRSSEVKKNFALWWRRMNLKKVATWKLKALPQRKEGRSENGETKEFFLHLFNCKLPNLSYQSPITKVIIQWPWLIDLNTWIEVVLKWSMLWVWFSSKNIMQSIIRRQKKKGFWNELARCFCRAFLYAITRIATTTIENAIIHSYHLVGGNCSFPFCLHRTRHLLLLTI
jgi:hypothetical protein